MNEESRERKKKEHNNVGEKPGWRVYGVLYTILETLNLKFYFKNSQKMYSGIWYTYEVYEPPKSTTLSKGQWFQPLTTGMICD